MTTGLGGDSVDENMLPKFDYYVDESDPDTGLSSLVPAPLGKVARVKQAVLLLAMAALPLCLLAGCGGSLQQQGSDDAQRWKATKKAANGKLVFQRGSEGGEI